MISSPLKFSPAGLACLILMAALGHAQLALMAMRDKSTTSDELAHVTGGYTFNRWDDYRLHPENGLLPQRWQALPLGFSDVHYPEFAGRDWRESNVWMIGHGLFYDLGNNHEWILFIARAMNTVFGIATVLLVAIWAKYFFGWPGAFTAAFFCALCPTMIAHSALATSDMAMAFFLLASASTYWWHLNDGRRRVLLLSVATFSLACVAKYTAVLLLPLLLLMAVIRILRPVPLSVGGRIFSTPATRLTAVSCSTLAHGGMAVLTIWAFCGFRYTAFNPILPPGSFTPPWEYVLSIGGAKAQIINICRKWHLLPEAYLYGFSFVLRYAEARAAFLDGEYSIFGWVSFFPKAFLYKTPPSLLVALGAAMTATWFRVREKGRRYLLTQLYRATPLWSLFVLYWGVSLTSHLNIGHRHLLPTYPILYIFCGLLGWEIFRGIQTSRTNRFILGSALTGLLAWHAAIAAKIYPDYLAYFSPVTGGPGEGYQHLADSSLDWGQDLPGLEKWLHLNRRKQEPLYLSYFGTSEPDYYGINGVRMPMVYGFHRERPWYWLEPGIYALSATMLQNVYLELRGPWTQENERQYQALRQNDPAFRALFSKPRGHPELLQNLTLFQWDAAWNVYERLRFARLCHYLRARRPEAMIGYSILIFRLSQIEIDNAVNGPVSKLATAIENTSQSRIQSNAPH